MAYTLLLCDTGALAISPSVYTSCRSTPPRDLRGVTMLAYSPHLLVVHPSVPANNLAELVALSQDPAAELCGDGHRQRAASGRRGGGACHRREVAVHPLQGRLTGHCDTVGGQTQVLMNGMLATLPHVQSGKLKLLGVSKAPACR
jgi:tripartite-type tricarboxylate transporter receptor subunit TctC